MQEYITKVTREEVHSVSELALRMERLFQLGKADRQQEKPCASANGCYLDGWYSPETDYRFIPKGAAYLL